MKQFLVSFQAKVKCCRKATFFTDDIFEDYLPHEIFQDGVVSLFLVTLYLPFNTLQCILFAWSLVATLAQSSHLNVFSSPKQWSNVMCLFKPKLNQLKCCRKATVFTDYIFEAHEIFQGGTVLSFLVTFYLPFNTLQCILFSWSMVAG